MNTRPTYGNIQPSEIGGINHRVARRARLEHRHGWGNDPIPAEFDAKKFVMPTAVAAIRKAFTTARTSTDAWHGHQRRGRFDIRQGMAATRCEQDVFRRKVGVSTTKVKCSVLVDASGSMGYGSSGRIQNPLAPTGRALGVTAHMAAAVFGATIATALGTVPTVDLDIFQHDAGSGTLTIKWRWTKGTPVAVFNEAARGGIGGGGGNADGHALFAITERMKREIRPGERGVILMVSDGLPSQYSTDGLGDAGQALVDAVAHARKAGFEVIAVAIDGSDQTAYYGKDGFIKFTGNWTALGADLAGRIGKSLAKRR